MAHVTAGICGIEPRAAVFGAPRQSSGTAEVYAMHKKPQGAISALQQTVGVLQN
jgi:hypothetical protein